MKQTNHAGFFLIEYWISQTFISVFKGSNTGIFKVNVQMYL